MPPRKSSTKRKKSLPLSATAPTPVDDHELPTPEVKTEAELADVAKPETKETLGQVEASNRNPAEIGGDSTRGGVVSSKLVIKEDVILENSAVVDMNEASHEDGKPDVGGDKAKEDLRVGSKDVNKGKQGVGVRTNENGVISLGKDEQDETIGKEKKHLQQGSKNVDEEKQGAGVEKDDNGVVGIDASQLETNSSKIFSDF